MNSSAVFDWLVVGGGPCGILAAAAILESFQVHRAGRLAWFEKGNFSSVGRFGRYRDVPGNTPVGHITDAFSTYGSLHFIEDQGARKSQGHVVLSSFDPTKTCPLAPAIDALHDASERLRRNARVDAREGTEVRTLVYEEHSGTWAAFGYASSVPAKDDSQVPNPSEVVRLASAKRVLLVPGRVPAMPRLATESAVVIVPLEDAVDPTKVVALLAGDGARMKAWTVVGNSHSGMLVVQNLVIAGVPPGHITVLHRSPLKFAEARDGGRWVKYDGTGLKGTVRAWVKESMPVDLKFALFDDQRSWDDQLIGADFAVFAHGFVKGGSDLPEVFVLGAMGGAAGAAAGAATFEKNKIESSAEQRVSVSVDAVGEKGLGRRSWALGSEADGSALENAVRLAWPEAGGVPVPGIHYDGRTGQILGLPAAAAASELGSGKGKGSGSVFGLFGAGFGFPEQWTDPEGHTEVRVGFNKVYLAHLDRILAAAHEGL